MPPVRPVPAWRDPWAWLSALAVLPLVVRLAGAPVGEPVAEDFDFLHRIRFQGLGSLLDGGGSRAFWRPLAHQLYYATFAPLILSHPVVVVAFHALLLAAGALLLYRVFRGGLTGPQAAIAASFPLVAESTRTIVAWPSQFVDVGLFFFSTLALHEASRRRLATALTALLAALLCKELAVVTAVLMPLLPGKRARAERLRWAFASAAILVLWGATYSLVRRAAHLELPHGLAHDAATIATSLLPRLAWAVSASMRAILSLALATGPRDAIALGLFVALIAIAALVCVARRDARIRWMQGRGWMAWGLAWFVLSSAALTPIYPLWQPNRSQMGSLGLGASLAALLGAAHPGLGGALVATRLALLGLAPGAPRTIAIDAPETGAFVDFERLSRLQRFLRESRSVLVGAHPRLPEHSIVLVANLPHALRYAFGGDRALQVWYRDSTLHMQTVEAFRRDPKMQVQAIIEFQPHLEPEILLINPAAARSQENAYALLTSGHASEALAGIDRADSLEPNPAAFVFHGGNAGIRAFALNELGRPDDSEREARRGLALYPRDENSRLVVAAHLARRNQLAEAERHLDTLLLRDNPANSAARSLRDRIAAVRSRPLPSDRAP